MRTPANVTWAPLYPGPNTRPREPERRLKRERERVLYTARESERVRERARAIMGLWMWVLGGFGSITICIRLAVSGSALIRHLSTL